MSPTAPARSLDQRREALVKANALRVQRAALKRDLRTGTARLSQLVDDPPEWLLGAQITDLLLAVPGIGAMRVGAFLRRCNVAPRKTVGGLTERQRAVMVGQLAWHEERSAHVRRGEAVA